MSEVNDRPTVLVVDDEAGLADLYSTWLEGDYDTETVYTGREAIERLSDDIDFVLLDRRMPGVSGDEVLAHIRSREFDYPVAMVSGIKPNLDLLDLRIDGYLTKPIEREDLRELVEEFITVSRYDEPLREVHRLARTLSAVNQAVPDEELEVSEQYMDLHRRLKDLHGALGDGTVGDELNDLDSTVRTLLNNPPSTD